MNHRDMYDLYQYPGIKETKNPCAEVVSKPIQRGDVIDYKGDLLLIEDAVWCEWDKKWCHKDEAIWIDYMAFWTTPEYSKAEDFKKPTCTKKEMEEFFGDLSDATLSNIKEKEEKTLAVKWYKKGKLESDEL